MTIVSFYYMTKSTPFIQLSYLAVVLSLIHLWPHQLSKQRRKLLVMVLKDENIHFRHLHLNDNLSYDLAVRFVCLYEVTSEVPTLKSTARRFIRSFRTLITYIIELHENTRKYDHINPIIKKLHSLPVRQCIHFKILLITY